MKKIICAVVCVATIAVLLAGSAFAAPYMISDLEWSGLEFTVYPAPISVEREVYSFTDLNNVAHEHTSIRFWIEPGTILSGIAENVPSDTEERIELRTSGIFWPTYPCQIIGGGSAMGWGETWHGTSEGWGSSRISGDVPSWVQPSVAPWEWQGCYGRWPLLGQNFAISNLTGNRSLNFHFVESVSLNSNFAASRPINWQDREARFSIKNITDMPRTINVISANFVNGVFSGILDFDTITILDSEQFDASVRFSANSTIFVWEAGTMAPIIMPFNPNQ